MSKYGLPQTTISQIHEVLAQFAAIDTAILYGSRAKGTFRDGSDIDLCLKTHGSEPDNLLVKVSLALEALDIPYQLDIALFRHLDNPDLIAHIERVGVVFYLREEYLRRQQQVAKQLLGDEVDGPALTHDDDIETLIEARAAINMDIGAGYQSEAQLEQSLVDRLVALGYAKVTLKNAEDLRFNLKTQLEIHNKIELTDGEFQQIVSHLDKGNVFQRAVTLREPYYLNRDDGTSTHIQFFNTVHWCQNQYQVTTQVTQVGKYENRYDVTLLINGLPLVQIELKRRGVELKEAFHQINRYQRHSFWAENGLFNYVQLFVISNGVNTKYYANNRKQDFKQTFFWSDRDNNAITQLEAFSDVFLEKCHVSKMIAKYTVLHQSNKLLMVLRPYQYYAAEAIVEQVKTGRKNGYIWHTTGSGKTLTSFKAAQLLKEMPKVDKVVFVVDRADLDYQTTQEFNYFSPGSVDGTENTKALVEQMSGPNKLIITTIQKLNTAIKKSRYEAAMKPLSESRVVFIFDECHRSQFGDTHKNITAFFTKAQLFGFTGTPILEDNAITNRFGMRTTKNLFGDCLHKYLITHAIGDDNVLKFAVEYWGSFKLKDGSFIDQQVSGINTREAFEDERRLEKNVNWIIHNHERKTYNRHFSAIMCVSNVDMLLKYYQVFQRKRQSGEHDLRVITCFTPGVNTADDDADGLVGDPDFDIRTDDPKTKHSREQLEACIADYNAMYQTRHSAKDSQAFYAYYKDITRRMKSRDYENFVEKDRVDILLVVNMYLTGFDMKKLNTLYVDKNLQYHGLIQAFSRTNRILGDLKAQGNVVCFRPLKDSTDEAIRLFCDGDASEEVLMAPYEAYVAQFSETLQQIQDLAATPEAVDDLVNEHEQFAFVKAFRKLIRTLNKLRPFSEFDWQDLPLSEQAFEDYKSKYLDIYDRHRSGNKEDAVSILDEVDFELELIHRDEINVAYILQLLGELEKKRRTQGGATEEVVKARQQIFDLLGGETQLRSKRQLIEAFIDDYLPEVPELDDLPALFSGYWNKEKRRAIHQFCQQEQLDKARLYRLLDEYHFTGKDPLREDFFQCLTYKPKLMERKKLYQRLLDQFKQMVHTYEDDTGALMLAEDPAEYDTRPLTAFVHRIGDTPIYFSDEVQQSRHVTEIARVTVKLDQPYEHHLSTLMAYDVGHELLARGVVSDEILTHYLQWVGEFDQQLQETSQIDFTTAFDSERQLFWSLSEAREGSTVLEFILNYWDVMMGVSATVSAPAVCVMKFIKDYPKLMDGLARIQTDLKARKEKNAQDEETALIITEDLAAEFKKLRNQDKH
ncbi:type I restriction endonuclease subunit R, EcoR124 family [Vibrio spartinae]|uniref:Type I restriction enzyme endonuclease subunit n=1 Tax=Vibrio spartinae TaxID=1918945 RepID=A0A1N6M8I6_9VIBR|nr:HsdR family type I site-specific deoxyribonuclease [Vibrio spartinae]SIO95755.1 Type-1 restriction enzyme R protein [Vibrio spartinae]